MSPCLDSSNLDDIRSLEVVEEEVEQASKKFKDGFEYDKLRKLGVRVTVNEQPID